MDEDRHWRLIGLGFGLASTGVSLFLIASFPEAVKAIAVVLCAFGLAAVIVGYFWP